MSLLLRCLCRPRPLLGQFFRKSSEAATNALFRNNARLNAIRLKDRLPPDYQMVYQAPMGLYFAFSQGLTYVSLVLMGILAAEKFYPEYFPFPPSNNEAPTVTKEEKVDYMAGTPTETAILLSAYAGLCIAVTRLMMRYPIRMYRHGNEYRAVFYSLVPAMKRHVMTRAGEVRKEKGWGVIPWQMSTYSTAEGAKMVLMEQYFKSPADFNRLMGYDKDSAQK